MSSQIATTLEVYVYAEDGITPINNASIELQPTNANISKEIQSSNSQGEITFTNPIGSNEFHLIIKDERFYPNAKNDIKRVTNSFTTANNTITLNLIPKIWLYFNGKELYIHQGNKVIQSFQAFSGNALSLRQKENGYKHFVEHKDKELLSSTTNYFCFDKAWQQEKDKGVIPEGNYYVNINESKDNKIDSGIRMYENASFSTSKSKEGDGKWDKYNIPIYTDKNCTNTIESSTQRDGFYIHGGESYNGGIDLRKEESFFIMLQKLRDEVINKNYETNDKPIVIDLIVDYSHIDIRVESIDIKRVISTNNLYNINDTHMVILTANFSPKTESMSEKVYNAKKLQTLWGYKEILQIEEFNPNEIRLSDIELFTKNKIINTALQETNDNPTHNTSNQAHTNNDVVINDNNQTYINNNPQMPKQYQGETLEIDLVGNITGEGENRNNWNSFNKQIIFFAYTSLNLVDTIDNTPNQNNTNTTNTNNQTNTQTNNDTFLNISYKLITRGFRYDMLKRVFNGINYNLINTAPTTDEKRQRVAEVETKIQILKDIVDELNRIHNDEPMFVHYKLDTRARINFFFAQVLAETGNRLTLREILPNSNSVSGGENFRGRGLLHITHDYTYRIFTQYARRFNVNESFETNPELLATNGKYAMMAGGFFWTWESKRYFLRRSSKYYHLFNIKFTHRLLWEIENADATDIEKNEAITRLVNGWGATNKTINDRLTYYNHLTSEGMFNEVY